MLKRLRIKLLCDTISKADLASRNAKQAGAWMSRRSQIYSSKIKAVFFGEDFSVKHIIWVMFPRTQYTGSEMFLKLP